MIECFRNVIQQLNERAVAAGYAPLVVECYNDIAADPRLIAGMSLYEQANTGLIYAYYIF